MAAVDLATPPSLLRRLTIPVGLGVAALVAVAWYVTWTSSDRAMAVMAPATFGATDLALFFALIVVMMVAMMLPSALPMALAYHGLTRLENGQPSKPADVLGSVAFVVPSFLFWGFFGVAALVGLMGLGLVVSMLGGPTLLISAATLFAGGLWQVTRTKEICLSHCTSPMGFVLQYWRSGRIGAMRMGFRHSLYCIGCCWLFMLVLFISGSMSLLWMGGISVASFPKKLMPSKMAIAGKAIEEVTKGKGSGGRPKMTAPRMMAGPTPIRFAIRPEKIAPRIPPTDERPNKRPSVVAVNPRSFRKRRNKAEKTALEKKFDQPVQAAMCRNRRSRRTT